MIAADVFHALGEPTRLELVQRLVQSPRQQISGLTKGLNLTRQGARRHLQVLADAKVVRLQPVGRKVYVEIDHETLQQASRFIARLESDWIDRLDNLKRNIEAD